jgi:hypothetical protein
MFATSRTAFLQNRHELADAELLRAAPSIFAGTAAQGVSNRYAFLPTAQVVTRMRDAGWAPVEAREQRVRLEGRAGFQKHLLRFQRRDLIAVKGEYAAEICLVNSHDCSSAYQLHAGLFRFVCGNGMMVADSTFERVSIRHSGFTPDQVIDASFQVLDQVPQITASVEALRARRLTPAESQAFAESALLLRYDDLQTAPIAADKLLQSRRMEDSGDNLWATFNRVQENLLSGGLKDWTRRKADGHRHPRTRAVAGLDENIRLNKSLWHLATTLQKTGDIITLPE